MAVPAKREMKLFIESNHSFFIPALASSLLIVAVSHEYFKKITQDRIEAIDSDLMKEQHPDMPINVERQSKVTFGGGRKS